LKNKSYLGRKKARKNALQLTKRVLTVKVER